ncbi:MULTISPECIES: fatty acid desaturase CarF family protein [Sphingomonadales]|uniref:Kua-ubiquitin conjugating enzyme hybrid localization domain protein n=1 Tax=Edaphosphingomonas haloaromaticamans TaxID=653954 RepID=A0A1S1HEP5_9SPHN|nr:MULTISPECIES: fatty acid desaturase CarF family protein [Sphingomonas]AGH50540.1 hypothetical protein G432_14105 [Sphingomonas sp. MM-1]OHT18970.1 Kua-ubiquitin conjugating enzyme hybrid localization domain protein [Sphingomonas haloaromaticamans]
MTGRKFTIFAIVLLFAGSLALNLAGAVDRWSWLIPPAMIAGWYAADLMSGLVHMYMDYRPCRPGMGLDRLYFYEGSRESDHYQALFRQTMAQLSPLERLVYDFKNHHPRPNALGRRTMWRQIGSTVIAGALPASILLNILWLALPVPGWAVAGAITFILGGTFAQYFHGTLHRDHNPPVVRAMRRLGLLMTPAAHQLHHDSLARDFATNCGWSNPVVNLIFNAATRRGLLTPAGLEPTA